jgi:hypothetical protein
MRQVSYFAGAGVISREAPELAVTAPPIRIRKSAVGAKILSRDREPRAQKHVALDWGRLGLGSAAPIA